MKKRTIGWIFLLILASCSPEVPGANGPESVVSDIENKFEGEHYTYASYEANSLEILLKGKKIVYLNKESKLEMKEISTKIKSGDDFIYLLAAHGIYHMQTKDFKFTEQVKIAIEKKYLLEGAVFLWNNTDKSLKSELNQMVNLRDIEGVLMQGMNFISLTKEKKMNIQNVSITIPEKVAQDEGIN